MNNNMDHSVNSFEDESEVLSFYYKNSRVKRNKLPGSYTAQIKILSPADILQESFGEVKKAETVSYRNLKAEKGGLCCEAIFGPTKDYECLCGKYKKIKYKNTICEKCGVEVTVSSVRRYRSGHIKLASPVINPLFLKTTKITDLLGITKLQLMSILSFNNYLVLDSGNTTLKRFQVLNHAEFDSYKEKFGYFSFKVENGPKAIHIALGSLNLQEEYDKLNALIKSSIKSKAKLDLAMRRLQTIIDFLFSNTNPADMVFTYIPVLPPELRPLMCVDGKMITADSNSLYANLIERNLRLQKFYDVSAPDIIIQNETTMLQQAVNSLIIGAGTPTKTDVVSLKSLSDSFKGKQGRFRQNLLGKRVDYSARAVITPAPDINLSQCVIPKTVALELFKPHLMHHLIMRGHANSVFIANKLINQKSCIIWEILNLIIEKACILLNRAPTLHRLGIQAFYILLTESETIGLHPLVCKAFNADFDGDQMGIHLPLTLEAQIEARVLMLSVNNITNIANREIIITPRKDTALGTYIATLEFEEKAENIRNFYCYRDVRCALEAKVINYNSRIKYHFRYEDSKNQEERDIFKAMITTPGRVEILNLIPNDGKIDFQKWNCPFNVDRISGLVKEINRIYGSHATSEFCDKIMNLGFGFATSYGVSISAADIQVPNTKKAHIDKALSELLQIEEQYKDGIITMKEKENKITDIWSKSSNLIFEDLQKEITKNDGNRNINSLSVMKESGSRVANTQILQIGGIKGLVAKASEGVISTAVQTCYAEGLDPVGFFISSNGARKGNIDSALKTPLTGYLARKLVTVAQSCVIVDKTCGTKNGITYHSKNFNNKDIIDVVLGRVLAQDIIADNQVICKFGDVINKERYEKLKPLGLKEIKVKSPITCEEEFGVCAECYGNDIIADSLVPIGTAVGIIAAQSIGEPGTQLTLRTFHSGGATSKLDTVSSLRSKVGGELYFLENQLIHLENCSIFTGFNLNIEIIDQNGVRHSNVVEYGAKIYFRSGDKITENTKIADWDPYNSYIYAETSGKIKLDDLVRQVSYNEIYDQETGKTSKLIINWLENSKNLRPNISIVDTKEEVKKDANGYEYINYLSPGMILMVQAGDAVKVGEPLARIPKEVIFQKDITGGLPKVEDLLEARIPDSCSVVSHCDGYLSLNNSVSSKNRFSILSKDKEEYSFTASKNKCIFFRNGAWVKKGDVICDGNTNPHDLLTKGIDDLANYLISEVLGIYNMQGVNIDGKHIEVIIRNMVRKVEIVSLGDYNDEDIKVGTKHFIHHIAAINKQLISENKEPIQYKILLQGITKASLSTESFIEAATFQEPLKILTNAACRKQIDDLVGIKENVVIGNLAPTGTGVSSRRICAKYKN